jgi:predicted DCC family thiol-disulfide oxidoreductase YuxK
MIKSYVDKPLHFFTLLRFHLPCTLNLAMENQIVVIYDGECAFCKTSIEWIQQRLVLDAKPFQKANLESYGLTYQQCSQSVQVITNGTILAGAPAIAFLLKKRGNSLLSVIITASGPFGRFGYKWIAAHRSSFVVAALHQILKRANSRHEKKLKG